MRRILAVRQDNNGDVTLLGPALRALATRGAVTLLCAPSGEGAARLLPAVSAVVVARAEWIASDPEPIERSAIERTIALVAALDVDEAFVFTSFHQSPLPTALLLRLAGVRSIAAISVDYPGSLLDTRVTVSDDLHEVERALALVAARGYIPAPDDDGALRYLDLPPYEKALPGRYIAVQPGASVPARAWAPAKMRALVERLVRIGNDVVIVGSCGERDLAAFVAGGSGARSCAGETTFAQFAAIVRDADALVVGNTSGIHAAGAVGTPLVAIFPPTIPVVRFAPWRVPHLILGEQGISCAGCRARTCPIPGQPCTGVVTVEAVVEALAYLGLPMPLAAS